MAKYTTQLRTIVESYSYNNFTLSVKQQIQLAIPQIFSFTFPIWNEQYRTTLEEKIILHYYTKEIGLETVGLWKLFLEERLNMIMPYYNNLYATTVKDYDYLSNTKVTESFDNDKNTTVDNNNTTTNNTTETINNKVLNSDMPQANYSNLDYATNLQDIDSTRDNDTTVTDDGTNTAVIKDIYTKTTTGNTGASFTQLLMEYRESLINIDKMIIDELKDLFMMIY